MSRCNRQNQSLISTPIKRLARVNKCPYSKDESVVWDERGRGTYRVKHSTQSGPNVHNDLVLDLIGQSHLIQELELEHRR